MQNYYFRHYPNFEEPYLAFSHLLGVGYYAPIKPLAGVGECDVLNDDILLKFLLSGKCIPSRQGC